jgi:hypothetical protein
MRDRPPFSLITGDQDVAFEDVSNLFNGRTLQSVSYGQYDTSALPPLQHSSRG